MGESAFRPTIEQRGNHQQRGGGSKKALTIQAPKGYNYEMDYRSNYWVEAM